MRITAIEVGLTNAAIAVGLFLLNRLLANKDREAAAKAATADRDAAADASARAQQTADDAVAESRRAAAALEGMHQLFEGQATPPVVAWEITFDVGQQYVLRQVGAGTATNVSVDDHPRLTHLRIDTTMESGTSGTFLVSQAMTRAALNELVVRCDQLPLARVPIW